MICVLRVTVESQRYCIAPVKSAQGAVEQRLPARHKARGDLVDRPGDIAIVDQRGGEVAKLLTHGRCRRGLLGKSSRQGLAEAMIVLPALRQQLLEDVEPGVGEHTHGDMQRLVSSRQRFMNDSARQIDHVSRCDVKLDGLCSQRVALNLVRQAAIRQPDGSIIDEPVLGPMDLEDKYVMCVVMRRKSLEPRGVR